MPIRDYYCPTCIKSDNPQLKLGVLEFGFEFGKHSCEVCGTLMKITIANCRCAIKPSSETVKYTEKKERLEKRNRRLENMTPKQQDGFKKIIDSTGGKRYMA